VFGLAWPLALPGLGCEVREAHGGSLVRSSSLASLASSALTRVACRSSRASSSQRLTPPGISTVLVVTPAGNSHRSPLLLRRHSHPLWGDKNCRVGNPVTDSPPSESRRAGRRAGNRSARLPSAGGRVAAARHLQIALKMLRTEDATAAPRGGGRSGVGLAEGAREQPARRECAQSPPVAPASPGEAAATTWPSGYVIVAPFACLLRPLSARSIQPSRRKPAGIAFPISAFVFAFPFQQEIAANPDRMP